MTYDVLQDISDLTTVPKAQIENLFEKLMLVSCHDVAEQLMESNQTTELDLYFGKLYILVEDEKIKYKFIPSKKFENMMTNTIMSEMTPLITTIETVLKNRLENTYKDLF